MPEPTPSLLDAISTAIETEGHDIGSSPHEDAGTEIGDTSSDTGADDGSLLEKGGDQDASDGAEGADQGGEQGGEDAAGDKPASKDATNPAAEAAKLGVSNKRADGTFKSKSELAAEIKAKKAESGTARDHVNDPIPKDLKGETQERMRFLVNETKKLSGERDQARTDFDFIVNGIKATNTTPEQYGEILSFMALFNSGDAAQQEQALGLIEQMADRLATSLGRERTAADPLAAHADLKEAVTKGHIAAVYAKQLAIARNREKFNADLGTAHTSAQREQQAHAAATEAARVDLNALDDALSASDPQFTAIKAQIVPILKPLFAALPPRQWKEKFTEAYNNAKANFRAVPAVRPKNPGQQPMRAGRAAGGGGGDANADGMSGAGPATMLEAINAALARR